MAARGGGAQTHADEITGPTSVADTLLHGRHRKINQFAIFTAELPEGPESVHSDDSLILYSLFLFFQRQKMERASGKGGAEWTTTKEERDESGEFRCCIQLITWFYLQCQYSSVARVLGVSSRGQRLQIDLRGQVEDTHFLTSNKRDSKTSGMPQPFIYSERL